jgi:hypothetical protein
LFRLVVMALRATLTNVNRWGRAAVRPGDNGMSSLGHDVEFAWCQ